MPRAMSSRNRMRPSAVFFDFHPGDRSKSSRFFNKAYRLNKDKHSMRHMINRHDGYHSHSHEHIDEIEEYRSLHLFFFLKLWDIILVVIFI